MKVTIDLNPEEALALKRTAEHFLFRDDAASRRTVVAWCVVMGCDALLRAGQLCHPGSTFDLRALTPEEWAAHLVTRDQNVTERTR